MSNATAEVGPATFAKEREPRYRILSVNTTAVMDLLAGWRGREYVSLPLFKDLPDGCEVMAVHHDFTRNSFLVRIYHPSFPVIDYSMVHTDFLAEYEAVRIATKTGTFTVAAWAEDSVGLFDFPTMDEAEAFASGWSAGAGNYGAGKTTTYILPRDEAELKENPDDHKEVMRAVARRSKDRK